MKQRVISLHGVRHHNLKNISVDFPMGQISVITGVSGSGKSSLAFDTLYAEGQRRYIESLSTYTRQFLEKMPKPDLDSVENIPPAIALEQKNTVLNSRSTVGTQTEILDFLRMLFTHLGQTFCRLCNAPVHLVHAQFLLNWVFQWGIGKRVFILAPLKTITHSSSLSLSTFLRQQGYSRILYQRTPDMEEILDLSTGSDTLFETVHPGQLWVIVDRLKITAPAKNPTESQTEAEETEYSELRNRIRDAIEQALKLASGEVAFYDAAPTTQERWKHFREQFACTQCGAPHTLPEPHLFSFNSPKGACPECRGLGSILELDPNRVIPDPQKTLTEGALDPFAKPSTVAWGKALLQLAKISKIPTDCSYSELTQTQKKILWEGNPIYPKLPGILGYFAKMKQKSYKQHIRFFLHRYQVPKTCSHCQGSRFRPETQSVRLQGWSIAEALASPIQNTLQWIEQLTQNLLSNAPHTQKIHGIDEVLSQITRRLSFLTRVGLGYLSLDRLTRTLSGGEFQRTQLATQLGSGLCGTVYILDEPSIGLHAVDTSKLIHILKELRDQGNTVVLVEHDLEIMKAADQLIEIGPSAGQGGGRIVAQGRPQDLMTQPTSLTGRYLSGTLSVQRDRPQRPLSKKQLVLSGCSAHDLKNITVHFPLERLVVVTGASGSGKSTLIHQTLYPAICHFFEKNTLLGLSGPQGQQRNWKRLDGGEYLRGVELLDQSPLGASSRSHPATYLKAWDEIRTLYSQEPLSIRRGYSPGYFSFNVDGGRCPICKGTGEISIDLHFMASIQLPCEECGGKRFQKKVLEVTYRGKNIHELLETPIDEAWLLLKDHSHLARKLGRLRDVGLGYLALGQPTHTLSGGEAQRLKIAATLETKKEGPLLYLLDEPTTGLHLQDITRLMTLLHDLVDQGHSVILIEHHLDVIAQADWMIDLGPGGGAQGGSLVFEGPPWASMQHPTSLTGQALAQSLSDFQGRRNKGS